MNKRLFILAIFALISVTAFSQRVIFSESMDDAYKIPDKGRNRSHFGYFYTGYQTFVDAQGPVAAFPSRNLFFGRRTKYALSRHYSMGWSLEYQKTAYFIAEPESNDGLKLDSEKLVLHNLIAEYYNRITLGRVGDNIGKFIDIGVYGGWIFSNKEVNKYSILHADYEGISTYKNLDYIGSFCYGARARIGIDRIALVADYRITDAFVDQTQAGDSKFSVLPQISIGIELGLYKPIL